MEARICDTPSSIGALRMMTNGFVCCRKLVRILENRATAGTRS